MFRSFRRASFAALLTILSFAAAASPAHADSFTVTTVAYSNNETFVGIDSAGDFVINITNTLSYMNPMCGGVAVSPYSQCFETFYVGQSSPVLRLFLAAGLIGTTGADQMSAFRAKLTSFA